MDCRADHCGLIRAGRAVHDHEWIVRGNRGGTLNLLRIEVHVAQSCLDRDDMQ